ncbi:MAG: hypothetical protein IKO84_10430 [Butyrivibrio sp.]|nr:hypothetical protein [Butyrivibrio sp.]
MKREIGKLKRNLITITLLAAMFAATGCSEQEIDEFEAALEASNDMVLEEKTNEEAITDDSSEATEESSESNEEAAAKASSSENILSSEAATDASSTAPVANKPSDAAAPTQVKAPAETKEQAPVQDQAPAKEQTQAGDTQSKGGAGFGVKTKFVTKDDVKGAEIVHYESPVFEADNGEYKAVVDKLNSLYEGYETQDIGKNTGETAFKQVLDTVSINETDKYVFISVLRVQEVGGPHPNVYNESYTISKETKDFAKLSDVQGLTDKQIQDAADQVYSDHNDKDYFVITEEVKKAIKSDQVHWKYDGNNLVLWFDYNQFTGGQPGDGEYAATIAL